MAKQDSMVDTDVWALGIDVGTASVRACVTLPDGRVAASAAHFLSRAHHPQHQEYITQSSREIWQLARKAVRELLAEVGDPNCTIRGIGVDATCSLVVLKRTAQDSSVPYPVDFGFQDLDQNVVLWMDHRSGKELVELTDKCAKEPFLDKIGGVFLPEMGVPKLKFLLDRIPSEDVSDLLFMELHDYVSIMLATDGDLRLYQSQVLHYDSDNFADSELALDGSTKGWSRRLLEKFGLQSLSADNFRLIGRLEPSVGGELLPLPFAGTRIGVVCDSFKKHVGLPIEKPIYIGHGVIDCYAGWVATVKELDDTLSMVAGTSTCYLIASEHENKVVPGVWGPFNNFIRDHYISEGGQSATGSLIEHLFKSHPAYKELEQTSKDAGTSVYDLLDKIIDSLTVEAGVPVANCLVKHRFLYGNLFGNRTPYADPEMRAAYIGESADLSIKDLLLKYLLILEFLALETRQIVEVLVNGGYQIRKISISGSQSHNKRLVGMLATATQLPIVSYESQSATFTVVKGASMLGFAAAYGVDITQIMGVINDLQEKHEPEPSSELKKILDAKYLIMVDMAESQQRYRRAMDAALGS